MSSEDDESSYDGSSYDGSSVVSGSSEASLDDEEAERRRLAARASKQASSEGGEEGGDDEDDESYITGSESASRSGSEDDESQAESQYSEDDDGSRSERSDDGSRSGDESQAESQYSDEGSRSERSGDEEGSYSGNDDEASQAENQHSEEEGSHSERSDHEDGGSPSGGGNDEESQAESQHSDEGGLSERSDHEDGGSHSGNDDEASQAENQHTEEGSHSERSDHEDGSSPNGGGGNEEESQAESQHSDEEEEEGSHSDDGSRSERSDDGGSRSGEDDESRYSGYSDHSGEDDRYADLDDNFDSASRHISNRGGDEKEEGEGKVEEEERWQEGDPNYRSGGEDDKSIASLKSQQSGTGSGSGGSERGGEDEDEGVISDSDEEERSQAEDDSEFGDDEDVGGVHDEGDQDKEEASLSGDDATGVSRGDDEGSEEASQSDDDTTGTDNSIVNDSEDEGSQDGPENEAGEVEEKPAPKDADENAASVGDRSEEGSEGEISDLEEEPTQKDDKDTASVEDSSGGKSEGQISDSDEEADDNDTASSAPSAGGSEGQISDSEEEEDDDNDAASSASSVGGAKGQISDSDEDEPTSKDTEDVASVGSEEGSEGQISDSGGEEEATQNDDKDTASAHSEEGSAEPISGSDEEQESTTRGIDKDTASAGSEEDSDGEEEATQNDDKDTASAHSEEGSAEPIDDFDGEEEPAASARSIVKGAASVGSVGSDEGSEGQISDSDGEEESACNKKAEDGPGEKTKATAAKPDKEDDESAGDSDQSDNDDNSESEGAISDSDEEDESTAGKESTVSARDVKESPAPKGDETSESDNDEANAVAKDATIDSLDGECSDSDDDSTAGEKTTASKPKLAEKSVIVPKAKAESDEESESEEESESDEESEDEESTKNESKAKGKSVSRKTEESDSEEESEDDESTKNESTAKGGNVLSKKEREESSGEESGSEDTPKMGKNVSNHSRNTDFENSSSGGDLSATSSDEPSIKRFVRKLTGNVTDYYTIQDLITKGEFASVYAAKNKKTGKVRAAKEMRKSPENESNNKLVLNEFEMLKELNHPSLVNLNELFENEKYYFLVTDVYKGGDLREELMKTGLYSEERAASLIKQVLACINYVHFEGIVHRDLKPGNILIQDNDQIRVIGFDGAARCAGKERLSETMGTVTYMAPEILGMSYGKQCDIWSMGVMLFLLLSGQQPFKGATNEETFTNIVDGKYAFSDPVWDAISNDAKDIIQQMLTFDENVRPTAAKALEHPWITSGGTSRTIKSLKSTSSAEAGKLIEKEKVEKKKEGVDPHTQLQIATCTFLATKLLPKGGASKIDKIFCAVAKKDGKLSEEEAKAAFSKFLGVDLIQKQLDQILSNADTTSAGGVTFTEFVYGVLDKKGLLTKESLSTAFDVFAQDDSAIITKHDLRDLLKLDLALEKKAAKSIVAEFDNEVSYSAFLSKAGLPPIIVKRVNKISKTDVPKEESESDSEVSEDMTDSDASDSEADTEYEDAKSLASADSHSVKFSASSFVSHRLGALTEHYEIVDYIAKGSYGVVCSALHKETGTVRAIKELKKSKKNQEKNELLLKEFHILKTLDHPNILQMHELFEDKRHYYIVTGVSKGGDLHRELKTRGKFEEADAALLMKQILICVNYCHKNNVVHRDLKPGNVLLEEHKKMEHIKVIDFGEAVVAGPTEKLTEITGTMAYMAPDVLGQSYGHKCDIWSCGVIAYLVLTGKQPFKGADDEETFRNIAKGTVSYDDPIWESLSTKSKDFVKKLLTWDQGERPNAAEALKQPWIVKKARRTLSMDDCVSTRQALSNLESFDAQSKLRVATCTFIATQLMDKKEKEKIDDVFRSIDYNNDGTLNREEVKFGYEKFFDKELTDDEIDAIFRHVDVSGTGELEYSQFLFGALDQKDLLSSKNLKKAFSIFDQDGSGDISLEELATMLAGNLSSDNEKDRRTLKKYVAQVDKDGDGMISYEEFVQMALGTPTQADTPSIEKPTSFEPSSPPIEEEDEENLEESFESTEGTPDATEISGDSRLRHLHKSINRASKREGNTRGHRDPPTLRVGRADPPSIHGLPVKSGPPADDPISAEEASEMSSSVQPEVLQEPSNSMNLQPLTGALARGRLRVPGRSARSEKIDEACQGFDRVQEKISRLRMLLSTNESPAGKQQPSKFGEQPLRTKRAPNVETLDSAFAKLSEIQRKMRALQALAKSNKV